jgi:hypothetical protein
VSPAVAYLWVAASILLNGCSHGPSQVSMRDSSYASQEEIAVRVAREEVKKMGWKRVKVDKVRYQDSRWAVDLSLVRRIPGGDATVLVSTNATVIRVIKGL